MAHAAVMQESVELPLLMTCRDGKVRRWMSLGMGIGWRRIDPIRRCCGVEKIDVGKNVDDEYGIF